MSLKKEKITPTQEQNFEVKEVNSKRICFEQANSIGSSIQTMSGNNLTTVEGSVGEETIAQAEEISENLSVKQEVIEQSSKGEEVDVPDIALSIVCDAKKEITKQIAEKEVKKEEQYKDPVSNCQEDTANSEDTNSVHSSELYDDVEFDELEHKDLKITSKRDNIREERNLRILTNIKINIALYCKFTLLQLKIYLI